MNAEIVIAELRLVSGLFLPSYLLHGGKSDGAKVHSEKAFLADRAAG
jgi:hypothetical protein